MGACLLAGPEAPGLRSGQRFPGQLQLRLPEPVPGLSQAVGSSPSLPLFLISLVALLVSAASIDLLHTSVSPFFFTLSLPTSLASVTPSGSLHFPLTSIDWPLGGFPSSPLATGSSLPPSGTIHFLPAQSSVSLYPRARAKSGHRKSRQEAVLPSLQTLLPHGATRHRDTSFCVPLRTPFFPLKGWGPNGALASNKLGKVAAGEEELSQVLTASRSWAQLFQGLLVTDIAPKWNAE